MAADILNARVDYSKPLETVLESAKVFFILHLDHGENRSWSATDLVLDTPAKGRYSVDFELVQVTGTWDEERKRLHERELEFATLIEGVHFISAGGEAGIKASYVEYHQDDEKKPIKKGLYILGSTTDVQGRPHFFRLATENGFANSKDNFGQRCFASELDTVETMKWPVQYLAVRRRTPL
ncbi:MAG: hypothetical protein U0487_00040 [Patescibacteria group bacterium]